MLFPVILLAAGIGALVLVALTAGRDEPPVHDPDLPVPPSSGMTRYKPVNAILAQLSAAAAQAGVPLGLLVGWVAKESGGKLATKPQPGPGDTKYDERGYFQLMPDESKALKLDHQRLSTDSTYSINGGLALIAYYSADVDKLGIAQRGTAYYWRLVKLVHSMGIGAVTKIIAAAKAADAVASWDALQQYAITHNSELLHAAGHSPAKWFPFIDAVYQVGAPFGFGTEATNVVGAAGDTSGQLYRDIPDPLDDLARAT